jgi:four helix bundle protein
MEGKIQSFRDLIAWQKGMELARRIYLATQQMPPDERFGLTNQMRRCSVSVPSNIAEGYGRQGRTDYIRFLKMARGSLAELATQYELATSLTMLMPDSTLQALLRETELILQSLISSLENKG